MNLRYQKRTGLRVRGLFFIIAAIAVLVVAGIYIKEEVLPSTKHVKPDFHGLAKPIFVAGELQEASAIGTKEGIKLPLSVVQKNIDATIRYEKKSKTIIMATHDKLIHFKTDELTGRVNSKPFELFFTAEQVKGTLYLPIAPLEELYGLQVKEDPSTGTVTLFKAGDQVQSAKTVKLKKEEKTLPLRVGPSIHKPIVQDVKQGENLRIWADLDGWYKVQLENGIVGFLQDSDVEMGEQLTIEQVPASSEHPVEKIDGPINLIWEAVYNKTPDVNKIGPLPGVNVVSPTWFSLLDGQGNVQSKADTAYVNWAHANNMQVWALFSNSFEPKLTTEALSTFDRRFQMIQQVMSYAQIYRIDGINIDFENVYTKDKENYTQFIRELTPMLRAQGLVVSVDVTPKSNSEMWSAFLDRKSLGELVDYMMVMSYDEHWASSPRAGSVSSLPWAENAMRRIIDEDQVPADKLLLGVPLYTRIWTETTVDGKTKVSSKTAGMKSIQELIEKKKLKPQFDAAAGQNYVEYEEDGAKRRIWIEDGTSLEARVKLAEELGLAGTASWTRSFALPEAWEVLAR
ncbi:glycosyl hydrolase family 18 protein [Paenibacillus guangzhouensis]|uniref:glycosyl hydrolase family 18 protein n=1 Tax=Paenibacillus guangzhouensis TaxID=1473112 RepID=UPI001267247F|nr:glycosyl hydrolase family 18 protein [Paenibacillus guangzhouensis]